MIATDRPLNPTLELALRLRPLWAGLGLAQLIFIYWSSSRTWDADLPRVALDWGNFLHFPLYGSLATWIHLARRGPLLRGRQAFMTVLITAGLGVADEWHQAFVPGRDFSLWDGATDALAAAFAVVFVDRICVGQEKRPKWLQYLIVTTIGALVTSFLLPKIWPDL